MDDSLSPAERSLRARMAARALHSRVDGHEHTAKARAAGPGSSAYWLDKVDPDGELEDRERRKHAEHAKAEYFTRLAYKSARARRKKREGNG